MGGAKRGVGAAAAGRRGVRGRRTPVAETPAQRRQREMQEAEKRRRAAWRKQVEATLTKFKVWRAMVGRRDNAWHLVCRF